MSGPHVTVSHSIWIRRSRADVFNYTQDYTKRPEWDAGVISAEASSDGGGKIVKIRARGNITMTFYYKLYDPPRRTSLAARDVNSAIIESGGGSWNYEEKEGGTLWTQNNTLILKKVLFAGILTKIIGWSMRRRTARAMEKAKRILEGRNS